MGDLLMYYLSAFKRASGTKVDTMWRTNGPYSVPRSVLKG